MGLIDGKERDANPLDGLPKPLIVESLGRDIEELERARADLIHNFGDALTAVPLGFAFFLRSFRGEKLAGLAVVLAIFVSACVALYETIQRLIHPQQLSHLWVLAGNACVALWVLFEVGVLSLLTP